MSAPSPYSPFLARTTRILGGVFGATVLLALLSSSSPIRWDLKALGYMMPRAGEGELPMGKSILFVSPTGEGRSADISHYGLELRTFPDGQAVWMAFREAVGAVPWDLRLAVDRDGVVWRQHDGAWVVEPQEVIQALLRDTSILAMDQATATETRRRLSLGAGHAVYTLAPNHLGFATKPAWRFPLATFARVFAVLVAWTFLVCLATRCLVRSGSSAVFAAALAVPLGLAVWIAAVYLLGLVSALAVPLAAVACVVGGTLGHLLVRAAGAGQPPPLEPGHPAVQGSSRPRRFRWLSACGVCGAAIIALWFVTCVFQMDFDGDLFTHWLPAARLHHLEGRHDVASLVAHYGVAHEATYPPAFPILLSTLMWMSNMPADASLQFGTECHVFVLLYRLCVVGLHASFLAALWGWVRQQRGSGDPSVSSTWLGAILALMGLVPLLRGQPYAAEVVLVPLVGLAVLSFIDGVGSMRHSSIYVAIGLSALCVFTKNDAMVIAPMIMGPWLLWYLLRRGWPSRSRLAADIAVLTVSALPVLLWWLDRARCGADANFMFRPVALSGLLGDLGGTARVLARACRILLAHGEWLTVPLVLVGVLSGVASRERRVMDAVGAVLVGSGILGCLGAFALVFCFSAIDPIAHMDCAYERLAYSALVAAVLFAWTRTVQSRSGPCPSGAQGGEHA